MIKVEKMHLYQKHLPVLKFFHVFSAVLKTGVRIIAPEENCPTPG